ncbi:MAG: glycosyltransferase [Alphaproteobacteria bacterium]|nr:glycosyltransferase [Alphaproteobacteria bacterium]
MNVLSVTTLYPNRAQPVHGIFVENRLRHLAASGEVALTVVAPVPWFPFASPRFGRYAAYARAPRREERHGIEVFHPRYPVIPKIGMTLAPALLRRGAWPTVARLVRERGVQLIDAHYFYPDGVAAVAMARALGLPVCVTARGTDLNLIPQFPKPFEMIRQAAMDADAVITVCDALQGPLIDMGVPPAAITTLRNGVDLELFRPSDRAAARARWGVDGRVVVSVGGLVERKGHHLAIDALRALPDVTLLIAGEGEERAALEARIAASGLGGRARLLGLVSQDELPALYAAADALVLASSREGWANVLLEAMACGTPVVATDVWGTAEVVAAPEAGVLIDERSARAIADGLARLFADPPDRAATRAYAERFSWDATTAGQLRLFERLVG